MSSMMIASLGAAFSAALMLGLWAEESQRVAGVRPGDERWSPAALGMLRAEVAGLQGLMILLVTRPVSWVPAAGLVVLAAWAGVARFVRAARPESHRRWGWLASGGAVPAAWVLLVGVFLPVPGALGERVVTGAVVTAVMCGFFLGVRGLAWCAARLGGGSRRAPVPSEYAAAPESVRGPDRTN